MNKTSFAKKFFFLILTHRRFRVLFSAELFYSAGLARDFARAMSTFEHFATQKKILQN
jgi:hypothetical protein